MSALYGPAINDAWAWHYAVLLWDTPKALHLQIGKHKAWVPRSRVSTRNQRRRFDRKYEIEVAMQFSLFQDKFGD